MHPRPRHRRARVTAAAARLAVALLAVAALTLPGPPARAAVDGLALVTQTTYIAAPADGRIHVSIDATATAMTPDTASERTYYSGLSLVIQPGATFAAAASAIGNPLPVAVIEATDDVTVIDITFDREVHYRERYPFTVSFDLPDPGGQPNRDVRVGSSLVAFPVWAFGSPDTPGSQVEVIVPSGYTPIVEVGELVPGGQGIGGSTVLRSGQIIDALGWFAYVTAEAPGAFAEQQLDLTIGSEPAEVRIRGWEDDAAWSERMAGWMRGGIPELARIIGLPWPIRTDLEIEEAATGRLGEYAGVYDDLNERIQIRYDADAFVALHEAAHAWFNDRLIEDRWIGEAFASLYAVEAGTAAGFTVEPYVLDEGLEAYRIPLNAWGEIGAEDAGTEDFAYAATYEVARLIADRATIESLQGVWRDLGEHRSAYQPASAGATPEGSGAVTQDGWQRLLDFVEEETGEPFDDIWRDWIVTDDQLPLLDARIEARSDYAATVTAAGTWELPRQVRHVLAAWDFDDAEGLLEDANALLVQRDEIARAAEALDLEPPSRLRSLFVTDGSFDEAADEARLELATLGTIADVTRVVAEPISPLEAVGLLGSEPEAALATARSSFEAGDQETAVSAADRTMTLRSDAAATGRDRVVLGGASLLLLDAFVLLAVGAARQRRTGSRAPVEAAPLPHVRHEE